MLMTAWEAGALAPRLALPTLVVHDEQDRINPFSDGQAYAELAPQARLFSTSGLGHRRPLRDAQVLAEMMEFVAAPTP
jgi:pimeloyl-ACP methyl ester carboxylesterase